MIHPFHHPANNGPNNDGPLVRIEHVAIAFEKPVLLDVSLDIHKGETVAVLGKSGSGKSVLLKMIVGLLTPDSGKIFYKDQEITGMDEFGLMKIRSNMGFLFQGAALFDSMTVGQNLDLFLVKHTDLELPEREKKIIEALEMVQLKDSIDKMPSELSGGMKKRAGLARSIVIEPELILYDEPTTGLDPVTASSIADLIVTLQHQLGIASLVVTHDLPTAFTVSDRAMVLNKGRAIFEGEMKDLQNSNDPYLHEYLAASQLDRQRHDQLIHDYQGRQQHERANDREHGKPGEASKSVETDAPILT
jgi:phospholipid/cholesterol/gamma-HCH transport system ATP-binding protein